LISPVNIRLGDVLERDVLHQSPRPTCLGPRFNDAVINFRGRIIPLADLRLAFGLAASGSSADSRIIDATTEVAPRLDTLATGLHPARF